MVAPAAIASAIQRVTDRASFIRGLLADTLEWPIPETIVDLQDLGYGWTPLALVALSPPSPRPRHHRLPTPQIDVNMRHEQMLAVAALVQVLQ